MTKHCPYCGTILKETTWDRRFCPNCGVIEEDESSNEDSYGGYFG